MDVQAIAQGLPTLDQIDRQCYVFGEMFNVQLSDEDLFMRDAKKGTYQRLVYAVPQRLLHEEEQKLQDFMQYINRIRYPLPDEYRNNDRLMYRILAGDKYDHAKALQHMIVHSRWLRETYPINLGDIAPVLKSGMLYVSGRDYKYRPILILNVRRLIESNFETEIIASATAFFCDFVVKKLLIPGRIENWIMIIDLNDVGMTSLPVKKVKSIVGLTQQHFGGRLYRQFCINMSFMMRKSISVFLNFVDDITQ